MAGISHSGSAPLQLRILGRFRLERGGRTLRLPTHRAECLLAYLALHPESHLRERLAGRFWADVRDAQARHSLRTALATIRQVLGADTILADRETVRLNPDYPMWVDAREFETEADAGHEAAAANLALTSLSTSLQSLTDLYRGDLLSEFDDEWIGPERERLRALYLGALLRGVQQLRSESRYAEAIDWGQVVLRVEPANEQAHRHLIFCYAAQGERATALKQYEECRRVLRAELNAEPSAETTALFEHIKQELSGGKASDAILTNLPVPLTSFIGRQEAIVELKALLGGARLLTLVGAGGSGKTRLAIQVATELVKAFRYLNGAWWVDLSSLSDPALVPQTVASVFGLHEAPGTPIETALRYFLGTKELLLVIDNCEHLTGACGQLCDSLLQACPNLRILATSRETLGLTGEVVWRVPTLPVPDAEHLPPLEQLTAYDAVQLFAERARAVKTNWTLTENAVAVAQICVRLDGVPLAIELAAARLTALSAPQVAARLADRFQLLTGGSRTSLPRQQTLRATLDWSYDLLSGPERVLFRRLAVFAGGWTLEAAESVCSGEAIEQAGVLDLLERLVNKSLVIADDVGGGGHFHMLETVRQYAHEKLSAAGEDEQVRASHLDYFVQFAEAAAPKLRGPAQRQWAERLDADNDNMRAALEWSLGDGRVANGLRLAAALAPFWEMRAYFFEGRERLEQLLAQQGAAPRTLLRASALAGAGQMAAALGDIGAANRSSVEAIDIAREHGRAGWPVLAGVLARQPFYFMLEASAEAERGLEEAWAIAHELGDSWLMGGVLQRRAFWYMAQDNRAVARMTMEESLRYFRVAGDRRRETIVLRDIGRMLFLDRDIEGSRRHYEQSLSYFREALDRRNISISLNMLGEIERLAENDEAAKLYYVEALALARESGDQMRIPLYTANLAFVYLHLGDLARAEEQFGEALQQDHLRNAQESLDGDLQGFAGLAAAKRQPIRAAKLFGATERLTEALGQRLVMWSNPADEAERARNVELARAQLDEATFSAAWAEGRALTLEQAIALALGDG